MKATEEAKKELEAIEERIKSSTALETSDIKTIRKLYKATKQPVPMVLVRLYNRILGKRLTDGEVKSLKRAESEYTITCGDGLSLRILPSGTKVFQYRYKMPGDKTTRRYVIGKYGELSLQEARKSKFDAETKVKNGTDLNVEKKTQRLQEIADPTVNQAYERFKNEYLLSTNKEGKPNLKRPERQISYFNKDILPAIGSMKLKNVSKDVLVVILDKIVNRNAPKEANRTLSTLNKFYAWADSKYKITENPTLRIKREYVGGSEIKRKIHLEKNEIKTFFQTIDKACFSRQVQLILKILLLTGQRVGEVCNAEWSEVNHEKRIWTIPAEKAKNGDESSIPLQPIAFECFEELKQHAVYYNSEGEPLNSRWVCQSPQQKRAIPNDKKSPYITPEQPIRYTAINRAVKRRFDEIKTDIYGKRTDWIDTFEKKWWPHDLRRTFSTHAHEIGIQPHIVEAILNHRIPGVAGTYNQASYMEAKTEALERWEHWLRQLLSDAKVVSINKMASA